MSTSTNPEFLQVALQHLELEEPTLRTLASLPSIFCVCKRCYNECETSFTSHIVSLPLDSESHVTTSNLKISRDPRGFFASSLPLDPSFTCPPLEEQSYVPERVIGFFQFAKAKERILQLDQTRARVFSLTFLDLCEEFFKSLVLMQFPVFLGNLASENLASENLASENLASENLASENPEKAPLNPEKAKRTPCDRDRMQHGTLNPAKKAERIHLKRELKRKQRAARELKRRMLTPEE